MCLVFLNQLVGDQQGFCASFTNALLCLAWAVWSFEMTNFIKLLLMLGKRLFLLNTAIAAPVSEGQFLILDDPI